VVGTTTNASSKTVPIGSVISESPAAGTQVSAGSSVNLVISSGVAVPNVVNDTQAAATTAITGAGLVVGTISSASSSTVAIGSVISESPAAGTAVNGGSSVNLVISTGVTVPNVVGQTRAAATTAITAAGLVVGTTTSASSSTVPSGSVISENPVAGTHVNGGSAIALVISTGPAQYLLTTAANPPSGGTVTPATGNQNANAVVALKATPNPGYVFSNWTGPVANATSASTTVAMTGAESVTANFISALTVSPSPTYNFGTVYQGSITTQNFTVTNIGTTPFSISGAFISIVKGGNSNEFVEVDECPKSLAGGSHCTISVSFIAGPYYTPQTATLTITDNAPGNPQTVTLTATVIDPQASFNPTSLSFGNQTVNTSVTKTVTLKNTGGTALSITGMTVKGTNPAEFTLTPASNCGSSLGAGDSCVISVTFKPLAKVSYSATLNVTDNTQQGTQTVSLSGAGH
jgi:beta-lactam-binding protein with PASTA domain